MSEQNKAISRRLVEEAFNEGKLDVIDELVAPDFVNHDPSDPGGIRGPEGLKKFVRTYRSAFPDIRVTFEDQIAEGDKVVSRWSGSGTQKGELMGMPASGKQATVTGITIDRLEGGKIIESWNNWDTLGMLQQLGAVPEPARAQR
jgi:steroid delta-isomerase-like uncharacterized protein